jgi:hypothetical protein
MLSYFLWVRISTGVLDILLFCYNLHTLLFKNYVEKDYFNYPENIF